MYWPSGLRHKGGMNLIQALIWNVGTWALMLREKSKWQNHKDQSTNAEFRGGSTRSSEEVGESQWSEGVELSSFTNESTRNWEELIE